MLLSLLFLLNVTVAGRMTTEEEGPRQGGRLDGGRKAMTMDDDTARLMIRMMRRIIATKTHHTTSHTLRRIFGREFNQDENVIKIS